MKIKKKYRWGKPPGRDCNDPVWQRWFHNRMKDPEFAAHLEKTRTNLHRLAVQAQEFLGFYESLSDEEKEEFDRLCAEESRTIQ